MEFPFDINQLFPERISVLDHTLEAGGKFAGRPDLQACCATVIDELGKASARAQQLPAPVTSASKMKSQRHQLYLLKDGESNGGRGVVTGFLKIGYKKLFLLVSHHVAYCFVPRVVVWLSDVLFEILEVCPLSCVQDLQSVHVEAEPLCVLDFYIVESLQRHGYGLELFDFMLQDKNLDPVLMAYDRPSPKLLSFLANHYHLTENVPQVNNFVVFKSFFLNRSVH
ncbi:alpha-tubulin N-acetyltransferase 1 isoform X2 [Takifugu flavidus]|uniref:alpha-tubulin N-acetyltransferase 1 isoform X2 n=1 Tax=Takifugu flavidus TaxID=433684 RepID=UPI00254438A4|nr:alpha-tubulin N-acetyltransferase 1 isoform X2 [Takifugu flavidus]